MSISAQEGSVAITEEGKGKMSTKSSPVSFSGCPWEVNAVFQSLTYASAEDWHGWDKVIITVTDLGFDDLEPTPEPKTYVIYLSVAAVNDAPVVEISGFTVIDVLDRESASGDEIVSAFLVPASEDTSTTISSVTISDVDIAAAGASWSRPDVFFGTAGGHGRGDGEGMLALHPKVEVSLACTYGLLSLGGDHGGLEIEEGGGEDDGGTTLTVVGSLSNINGAMVEGIVYTPQPDWSGTDMVQVGASWNKIKCDMILTYAEVLR